MERVGEVAVVPGDRRCSAVQQGVGQCHVKSQAGSRKCTLSFTDPCYEKEVNQAMGEPLSARMAEVESGAIKARHTIKNQDTSPSFTADSCITYPQQLQHIITVGITSVGEISPLSFMVGVAAIPSGSQLFLPQIGHSGLNPISPKWCLSNFSCFGFSGINGGGARWPNDKVSDGDPPRSLHRLVERISACLICCARSWTFDL